MSAAKHTPTPFYIQRPNRAILIESKRRSIAEIFQANGADPDSEANAVFIVEACNAYDSDKATIKVLADALGLIVAEFNSDPRSTQCFDRRIIDQARAALAQAKAEGHA